jgi:prophage maintenance system killer protein
MELFLDLNGFALDAEDAALVATMEALAAGNLAESDLAAWLRNHMSR